MTPHQRIASWVLALGASWGILGAFLYGLYRILLLIVQYAQSVVR